MQDRQSPANDDRPQQVGDGFIADLDGAEQRPADDSLRLGESADHEGQDDGALELGEGIATTATADASDYATNAGTDGNDDGSACSDGANAWSGSRHIFFSSIHWRHCRRSGKRGTGSMGTLGRRR